MSVSSNISRYLCPGVPGSWCPGPGVPGSQDPRLPWVPRSRAPRSWGPRVLVSLGPRALGSPVPGPRVSGPRVPRSPTSAGPRLPDPWVLGPLNIASRIVDPGRYILCYILHIHFCITLSLQVYSLLLLIFVSTLSLSSN